jgi:hypothetical protein
LLKKEEEEEEVENIEKFMCINNFKSRAGYIWIDKK